MDFLSAEMAQKAHVAAVNRDYVAEPRLGAPLQQAVLGRAVPWLLCAAAAQERLRALPIPVQSTAPCRVSAARWLC